MINHARGHGGGGDTGDVFTVGRFYLKKKKFKAIHSDHFFVTDIWVCYGTLCSFLPF